MTKDLELKLVGKYPALLKEYGGDMRETCMHWGFQHQDGWFTILDEGLEKLQYLVECFDAAAGETSELTITSVKEKFGTLNIYYDTSGLNEIEDSIVRDVVIGIERESTRTCEVTGKWGKLRQDLRWIQTLCDEEYEKIKENRK
jgi:hypothetical protein